MEKVITQFDITNQILASNKEDININGHTKLVLVVMSQFFKDKDKTGVFTCHPSQSTLAKKACIGLSSVRKSLGILEELNYISSRQRMDKSKVYTWLGFDSEKTKEVKGFIEKESLRIMDKKKRDITRGEICGKNKAALNKHKGILVSSPNCNITKLIITSIELSMNENILYSESRHYKNIFSSRNTTQIEQQPLVEEYTPEPPVEEQPYFEQVPMDCYDNVDFEGVDRDYYIE